MPVFLAILLAAAGGLALYSRSKAKVSPGASSTSSGASPLPELAKTPPAGAPTVTAAVPDTTSNAGGLTKIPPAGA